MRPRSLLVAVSPVLVGSALACERTGRVPWLAVTLVFVVAVLVQVISNLQNDVGYTVRRADSSGTRTGLPRATANGWLGVRAVRTGIACCVALAVLLGLALAWYRGWPVVAIGALAAAAPAVNNHRDIAHDRGVGRRTFGVTFGAKASRRLYGALLFMPFALVPAMALLAGRVALLLPLLSLPLAVRVRRAFNARPQPQDAFVEWLAR
jgi:1,4-dihydroxy-2-naphthoate octaprenyltransferase